MTLNPSYFATPSSMKMTLSDSIPTSIEQLSVFILFTLIHFPVYYTILMSSVSTCLLHSILNFDHEFFLRILSTSPRWKSSEVKRSPG
jgi:hypothetical protein